ncbi:MAG: hypothetical protein IT370_27380 [Deltaproteobacteria bacterium]|nr:hypothetical protein [Deltaproteobacteria bacterium]
MGSATRRCVELRCLRSEVARAHDVDNVVRVDNQLAAIRSAGELVVHGAADLGSLQSELERAAALAEALRRQVRS